MAFPNLLPLLFLSCTFAKDQKEPSRNAKPIFGTKTEYGWIPTENDFFDHPPKLHQRLMYRNRNCSAMHVYAIFRHGARNPCLGDTQHMIRIQQKLSKIKSFGPITEHLKFWKSPFAEADEGQLIKLGRFEHIRNARHFMAAFDDVFFKEQRLQPLRMVSSTKQRCIDSMAAFADGVKSYMKAHRIDENDFKEQVTLSNNNTLLRFFSSCAKYQKEVKENKTAIADYYEFLKGQEIGKVVEKVNQKFRVKNSFFDSSDVRVMYVLCAFEQCLLNRSDWCRLLDPEDNASFEYLSDIKQYWTNAYGHKVNYQQSCPLVKDLLSNIHSSVRAHRIGKSYTKGHFLFGHAETLGPLYSDLGLFKDSRPLKAGNFKDQVHRKFRSSYILPFAANIAVVTYHCVVPEGIYIQRNDNDVFMEKSMDYVIQMYLNERLLEIPGSGSTCLLEDFLNKYKSIESCEFNQVCHLNDSS